jgi:calcium-dependent protein kinase
LTRNELLEGYSKLYGDMAEEEVDKILKIADLDGNGEIEYSEWVIATMDK